ncbi:hypothetical protein RCH23_002289 [Cryobacterium sp. CAN_C3]|nr:hypothetical protein [Cryobacterium sp. CAN_C3]
MRQREPHLELTNEIAERDLKESLMDRIVETFRKLGAGYWYLAEFDSALLRGQKRSVESVILGYEVLMGCWRRLLPRGCNFPGLSVGLPTQ